MSTPRVSATVRLGFVGVGAALALLSVGCSPDTTDSTTSTKKPTVTSAGAKATAGTSGTSTFGAAGTGTVTPTNTAPSGPPVSSGGQAAPIATAAGSGAGRGSQVPVTGAAGTTAPATAGSAPTTGAAGSAGSPDTMVPPATGDGPPLPAIMGDCPEFKNGTIMVAGHKGIQITAGAAGKGGPIVFYWHGTGSSTFEASMFAGTSEVTSSGGIIAAFNGSQSSKEGGDCSGTGTHFKADFNAADQIVACGVKNHGIDARRIYATGCSAGGLQTGCMGQMRSSYMAAVAPNSGGVVGPQPWQDKHSPAVFTMHGGSSDMVIVTFSQTSATFDMSAKQHGSFVVNCDHGGGHCAAPPDLQKAAWQFMKDHPWGVNPSPWANGIPAGVPSYCKIY